MRHWRRDRATPARNRGPRTDSAAPTAQELVRIAAISVIGQMQDELEAVMTASGITVGYMAAKLGLTPAMVRHVLESPDARLEDVAAFGVALGIHFRVTSQRS